MGPVLMHQIKNFLWKFCWEPQLQATYEMIIFLGATLKKQKETRGVSYILCNPIPRVIFQHMINVNAIEIFDIFLYCL